MSELKFRILLVPKETVDQENKHGLLCQVKSSVEDCGLKVISIKFHQVKENDENSCPEIEELRLDILAKSLDKRGTKREQYKKFCLKWGKIYCSLPCTAFLEFFEKDYFVNHSVIRSTVKYESMSFGVLTFDGHFFEHQRFDGNFGKEINFCHSVKTVKINYDCFELIFSYDNIRNIFVNIEHQVRKIYFDLCNPPLIFKLSNGNSENKLRNLNLTRDSDNGPLIDTDVLGRSNVLCVSINDASTVPQIFASIHHKCCEKSIYYSCISLSQKRKPNNPIIENMPFGCVYLLTAIFKRNFVTVSQSKDIYSDLNKLRKFSEENPDCLEKALISVLFALDSGKIVNYWHAIEKQYNYYNRNEMNFKNRTMPTNCYMIRRVVLTPTRQLLFPPEMMLGNRVLRKFDSEYSLRISFREENMTKLTNNACQADENVLKACITIPMNEGICIGPRKYDFLAWSNSQLRDHGVWMYARNENVTAGSIREWMGDFSHIHNLSNYMARMGQCFSQTESTMSLPLDSKLLRTVNDIEGGYDHANRRSYCFSDDIGRISTELAAQVRTILEQDTKCSAFQIRYGGYKGMLVEDPTLKDVQVEFRKSMKKFECPNSTNLEITRTSRPSRLQLNRPLISLLNGLGVSNNVFLKLQEDMLNDINDMLLEESKAWQYLRSHTPFLLHDYEELSFAGIHLTTESFFKFILLALHRHYRERIKSKANLTIDPSRGRNMLGVMDETNTLEYGEVFVQYTKDILSGQTTNDTQIIEGEVLVTKNPCHFPGDVRKFKAVDIPSLHHIVDCIVFPQKGPRPHPNEMAGSDLDGDEYAVLWDPELFFSGKNRQPADFPVYKSPKQATQITVPHMVDFLEEYIKKDQVGLIGFAHLATADKLGIDASGSLNIAEKLSIAVDFPKNGHNVILNKDDIPAEVPHFMETTFQSVAKTYKSKTALGQMYDVMKIFQLGKQEKVVEYNNIKIDPDLVYDGWEEYKSDAIKARNKYNDLISSLLSNYGIKHESEVFSGTLTNLHNRFKERNNKYETQKVLNAYLKTLVGFMKYHFIHEFPITEATDSIDTNILKKASAWYVVTYSDPKAKFLSFPWCISNFLAVIKVRKTLGKQPLFSPVIDNLNEEILQCSNEFSTSLNIDFNVLPNYSIVCEFQIINRSLITLHLWALNKNILSFEGHRTNKYLSRLDFLNIFMIVAELHGYIQRKAVLSHSERKNYSSGHLCLYFFKFCQSLLFCTKPEIVSKFSSKLEIREKTYCDELNVKSIQLKAWHRLAKESIVAYNNFVLKGSLHSILFDTDAGENQFMVDNLCINCSVFCNRIVPPNFQIKQSDLRNAEEILRRQCNVEEISLSQISNTEKIRVSAAGTKISINKLKEILRMEHSSLRKLFLTGELV